MTTKARRMSKTMTWRDLLELCQEHGRERVVAVLQSQFDALYNYQGGLWAEPDMHGEARALSPRLGMMADTLLRLRFMADADVASLLADGGTEKERSGDEHE